MAGTVLEIESIVRPVPLPNASVLPGNAQSIGTNKAAFFVAIAGSVIWAGAGVISVSGMSWLDTLNAATLLLATLAGLLLWRGMRMAQSPAGRLWSAGFYVATVLLLSPLFHRAAILDNAPSSAPAAGLMSRLGAYCFSWLFQPGVFIPLMGMLVLWLFSRAWPSEQRPQTNETSAAEAERFFLASRSVRLNLAAAGCVALFANAGLSGLPLQAALLQSVVLAATVFLMPALLNMASRPAGTLALSASMAAALGVSVCVGAARYLNVYEKVQSGNAALQQDKSQEALGLYTEAARLNKVLDAKAPGLEIETHWAQYYERKGDSYAKDPAQEKVYVGEYELALGHWAQVAHLRGIDEDGFLPMRRVLCKKGDSVNAWWQLIFNGFPAINHPEIAPGIMALGELPQSDLRGKLLSALLAWDQNAPPDECRRRLEAVQRVLPNEVSSYNLLRRMGKAMPDAVLQLPIELIAGPRIGRNVEELGELDTLVVMDQGHWEMGLNAHATPLHEEWPIIRILFQAPDEDRSKVHEIGRTQVNRAENYDVPFTFDVNRGNIYHVKIVFENRQEDFDEGHIARRGLVINGMTFRRAK